MLLRLCQLKSQLLFLIFLVILAGCATAHKKAPEGEAILSTFPNQWFSVNPGHSIVGSDGIPVSHMFFDTRPEFRSSNRVVNALIATPENSQHSYNIDLYSGQRYYEHTYCKQSDIWNEFSGIIHRPGFSVGYIPRVLDQLGGPQKVIIWTRLKNYHETAVHNYRDVKLVGAFVEQICRDGNCLGKNNWLSRLVLIAVDANDPELSKINNVTEFQKHFDWPTSKAHLQNINGRNFIGGESYPRVKISQLIEFSDGFDFFKKNTLFLTDRKLYQIQKSCHALYDSFWEEVGKVQPEDKPANTDEEIKQKLKLFESLKKEKKPIGFAARFQEFTKKYYQEMMTCEKMVYHGNINRDPEAFWFLSFMGIYYRLHQEGYYFDCRAGTWQRNVLNVQGEQVYDLRTGINDCNERMIDLAITYLPNFLTSLKGEKEYFRFIDYDNLVHGTHSKMYSWVKVKAPTLVCRKNPNTKILKETTVFPEDVQWKKREVKDKTSKEKWVY